MDGVPFLFNYPPVPAPHIHIDANPRQREKPRQHKLSGFYAF